MITLVYKQVSGLDLQVDIHPPWLSPPGIDTDSAIEEAPAVLFFHGGGLTVGNRTSWFPYWMQKRFTEKGYLFMSADYRLLPPSTGREIVEDVVDLWVFLNDPSLSFKFPELEGRAVNIRQGSMVVAGVSAGGLCAYLAAVHCNSPRPRAVLSCYGMGGDFLTPHYLTPKTQPFFRGRELLSPTDPSLRPFVFPFAPTSQSSAPTSDSPLSYNPPGHPTKPGYPSNPRMLLARLYLQLGTYLDYYTGEHEPSLSGQLREVLQAESEVIDKKGMLREAEKVIGENVLHLFPQFSLSNSKEDTIIWPPTVLIHGTDDTAVPIHESRNLYRLLTSSRDDTNKDIGNSGAVEDLLIEVPGAEHSFDLAPDAEEKYGEVFEKAVEFVHRAVFNMTGEGDSAC
ncbi:alpha/beta-hydrolase [Coprinellus micaceus]|uniref:Alpha/beta-hydrolase n=1 Tax=Coprinellus micaceus TaxID=71717 RepID=A0A4Y7U180_COPMI|nr:alpha/beta-hydrolase [Coprinellus micaceus]